MELSGFLIIIYIYYHPKFGRNRKCLEIGPVYQFPPTTTTRWWWWFIASRIFHPLCVLIVIVILLSGLLLTIIFLLLILGHHSDKDIMIMIMITRMPGMSGGRG